MAVVQFVQFMSETLEELSKLLAAGPSSLAFRSGACPTPGVYARTISIHPHSFQVELSPEMSDTWLMRVAANVTADCVQEKNLDLSLQSSWFIRQDAPEAYTAKTLAHELLILIYQYTLQHFHGAFNLQLDHFSSLSFFPYESESAGGTLCILPALKPSDKKSLENKLCPKFEEPLPRFSSKNLRQIRKLLAGAGESALLLAPVKDADSSTFGCYGYLPKKHISRVPYHVSIYGPGTWDFFARDYRLFRHEFDHLQLWRDPLREAVYALSQDLGVPESQSRPLLEAFARQRHGTSAIFINGGSSDEEKINRLVARKRSLSIRKLALGRKEVEAQLLSLSRMDGAFVIDVDQWAVTHIAAIVDGTAIIDADLSRGARHGSITTFIANLYQNDPSSHAVAVIFSEDGGAQAVRASQMGSKIISTPPLVTA